MAVKLVVVAFLLLSALWSPCADASGHERLDAGDLLIRQVSGHLIPLDINAIRRQVDYDVHGRQPDTGLSKRFPFFTEAPASNSTLFRAQALAVPIPHDDLDPVASSPINYGKHKRPLCQMRGELITRVWHYSPYGSKVADWLMRQMMRTISDPVNKAHFERVSRTFYTTENAGIALAAHVQTNLGDGSFNVTTALSDGYGVATTPLDFVGPCRSTELQVRGDLGLRGTVQLVGDRGWSVVSDIDDTIRVTGVLSPADAVRNTLARPFVPTKGFPEWYAQLNRDLADLSEAEIADAAKKGQLATPVAWHYVSGAPHFLYDAAREFVAATYPIGSFHLRVFGITRQDFWHGTAPHKAREIGALITRWPRRQYVLVGDSGEHDPEIYGAAYREWANANPAEGREGVHVACIYIRAVRGFNKLKEAKKNTRERFEAAFQGVPRAKWVVFNEPTELGKYDIANGVCSEREITSAFET